MFLILWILGWLITVGLVKEHLATTGKMFHGFEWFLAVLVQKVVALVEDLTIRSSEPLTGVKRS
jgi:hypothetical protein